MNVKVSHLHKTITGILDPKGEGYTSAEAAEKRAGSLVGTVVRENAKGRPVTEATLHELFGTLGYLEKVGGRDTSAAYVAKHPALVRTARQTCGLVGA